jgi:hypothetical protein
MVDSAEINHLTAAQQPLQKLADDQAADKRTFTTAVAQALDETGELCLGLAEWPVDVPQMVGRSVVPVFQDAQMMALEHVNLVSGTAVQVEQQQMFGPPKQQTVTRYNPTLQAGPYIRHPARIGFGAAPPDAKDFCYGKRVLDQVTNWEGPMTMGSYAEVGIAYTYKIESIAPWSNDPAVQKAFAVIGPSLSPAVGRHDRITLKKTAMGWNARGIE